MIDLSYGGFTLSEPGLSTSDAAALFKAVLDARAKSLEMLYDYTKFHIGVYLTLTTSYIAVASVRISDGAGKRIEFLRTNKGFMVAAVIFFLVAGFAGGVIVSSVTQYAAGGSADFLATPIGPWTLSYLRGIYWTYIEHTAFWLGLIFAIVSVAVPLWGSPRNRGIVETSGSDTAAVDQTG